jgi:hypothetical protein
MTDTVPFLDRRCLLGLLAGLPVLGQSGKARALRAVAAVPAFPDTATMLIAGPENGSLDRWNRVVQPALALSLPSDARLRRICVGAADGVTGANQFSARTAPDGQTILMAPGEAILARLVGDPRAQYDVSSWVFVMAALSPGVMVARPGAVGPERKVRIATAGPAGPDLPAILGLELLGARTEILPAMAPDSEGPALAGGSVDAVFLRGHRVPLRAEQLAALGCQPIFSLGILDAEGKPARCASFPEVPTLPELYAGIRGQFPAGPLVAAWRAASIASQLDFAVVLPQLTPAAMVALWRHAGTEATATLDVQATALSLGVRPLAGPEATATVALAVVDEAALSTLRRWLAERFGWRPG